MAALRKYGTCFFEQYAQISLSALLGSAYDCLENRDRPDLQSRDGHSIGIEVTRAMEESKRAEAALLKDVAGLTPAPDEDAERIAEYGYSFGLQGSGAGAKERLYWEMAQPMRRILASKVGKAGSGFYGRFEQMGLFVFCKEDLCEAEARQAMEYTMQLQQDNDIRYDRLFLADVDDLFVCRLEDGLASRERIVQHRVTSEQRKAFYLATVRLQIEK